MTTGVPILDLIADAQAALEVVAPSFSDAKALARNDLPNRYVWIKGDVATRETRQVGGNPKAIFCDVHTLTVHCWGPTEARAYRMRQALLSKLRQLAGASQLDPTSIRTTFKGGEGYSAQGWVAVVELNLELPLFEAKFTDLAGDVQDATRPTVRPTHVGFDATAAARGDGKLTVGED